MPVGSERTRRFELGLTTAVGSVTVLLSSLIILWVLGAFDDIGPRPLLEAEHFIVTPGCRDAGDYQVELEFESLTDSYVEITYFNETPLAEHCNVFAVTATQRMQVERAISMGWLGGDASIDGYRQHGGRQIAAHTRSSLSPEKDEPTTIITVDLKKGQEAANAIFLRLFLPDFTRKIDFSTGRARASFLLEGARDSEDSTHFFAIVHQDLRHTRIQGVNTDPTTPNVFQYNPARYEIEGRSPPTKVVLFDAEFDSIRDDKLRDVLLVAFSALFGVGVSALFESLLLSELLRRFAQMFGGDKR